jgi:hypothetical protein
MDMRQIGARDGQLDRLGSGCQQQLVEGDG